MARQAHLYLLQSPGDTAIKIGASDCPAERARALSKEYREELRTLALREGAGGGESSLHRLFREDRVEKLPGRASLLQKRPRGRSGPREWFRPSPRLLDFARFLRGEIALGAACVPAAEMLAWYRAVVTHDGWRATYRVCGHDRPWDNSCALCGSPKTAPTARAALRLESITGIPAELWGVDGAALVREGIAGSFAVGF